MKNDNMNSKLKSLRNVTRAVMIVFAAIVLYACVSDAVLITSKGKVTFFDVPLEKTFIYPDELDMDNRNPNARITSWTRLVSVEITDNANKTTVTAAVIADVLYRFLDNIFFLFIVITLINILVYSRLYTNSLQTENVATSFKVFSRKNAQRFIYIGIAALGCVIVKIICKTVQIYCLQQYIQVKDWDIDFLTVGKDISIVQYGTVAFICIVAYSVFKRGEKLQQESDLTV